MHKLDDLFFITLCTVICGCDGWVAIEKFANMKRSWFEQYLSLEHAIPSHDTLGRIFSLIDLGSEPHSVVDKAYNTIKKARILLFRLSFK